MVCEMISFIGSKAFIIFSVVTGRLVLGLRYDRTFNVQPQPIQFLEEPTDHVTLAGTDVTFVCSTKVLMTDDYSKPNITWLYNNITIKSGHHHIYYYNGSSTLTVKNVTSNDQGVYHCEVDEWRIKIRSRYGHLNVLKNKYQIAFINAPWGSTITLPCLPQSGGKSTWLKNKEERIDYKPNHSSLLEDGSLRLFNVDEDSSGHYQCLVNESNVIRNKSFHITVQKSSKQHTRPRIHSTSSSSQHLLIIPGKCDSSPHNQTVTLQCQVTGYPSPVISWYLNGVLVNFTEYNITDNVGNNTWIIQGGNPCRLIGYWQCFATNEVGTVHNDIRVLPYGWSTVPRSLALKAFSVVQSNDKEASASYKISWEPPSYLGGLNLTDIKYNVNISKIGVNITNNTYYIIPTKVNVRAALLKSFHVKVHLIYRQINAQYLPASMSSEDVYKNNDLIEIAINFLPPKFTINCLTNGNVVLHWSVQSSGNLSSEYINSFVKSWLFTGSCKNQQGDVYESTKYSEGNIGGEDNYVFHNLSNGTICSYTVSYLYMSTLSEASSAHCTVIRDDEQFTTSTINIATSTSFILPQASVNSSDISSTEVTASSIASTEVSATVSYDSSQTDITYSSNLSTSSDILNINVTKTNSVQKGLSTSSFLSTRATYSTINLTTIISPPPLHYNDSKKGLPSGLLGTILGLFLLLIVSTAVCTVMIVIYQYKRSRHNNEDYTFLKFSRYLKTIKSPLSNNYCSTINIADESVCEMPTSKVTKWINNNDFQHSASILQQSNSFNSLATSEMIAYIRKEGKNKDNKWLCSEDNRLQAEKLDNISCSELSTSSSSIPSHYLCEDNHKDETLSSFNGSASGHSFQCNSEVFTPSEGSSVPLQTNHLIKKKPADLLLSKKSTNVPLFSSRVTNSIFPDSYPLTSPPMQSFIESDLLSDILHTLPHADNDVLSQSSDNDSVPSHYLYDADCSNRERSLSLSDRDNTTHYCDDTSNNNRSQYNSEVILTQSSGDIDYDVLAPCHSYHVNNRKPTNLPLSNTIASAGTSLFAPQVINPIFNENTNLGSTNSNSLTSMSYDDKDTLNFMLNIQPNEDDGFSQGSSNSDMPSHYFYERNCCNVVSRTSSTSLNEFTHSSSDNIGDSSFTTEENVSVKNSNLCVYREPDSRKSVRLPKSADQKFADVSPADSGIYTSQSSNKINSPNAEFSSIWCKQLDCDEKGLSDLSFNSVTPSPIPSHYMHEQGLSDERSLCHYFDESVDGQIGHNIDTKDSSQTTTDYKSKCSDFCLNKTSVPNSLNLLFVNNRDKLSATNCNLPTASMQSESYRVPMKGFDLDTISQFSDSDTNSEFNAYGDSDYGDVNLGYMYVKS